MSDNPSLVLRGVKDLVFEQRPIPEIGDDEVLVEMRKTGICGSDVHYLVEGRIGDYVVKEPMVLGHESSGVISRVGVKVTNLHVGDRVALEPGATCGICILCKSGRYELCPNIIFAATPPYDGTLARYYRLPAHLAYILPDSVSFEEGAMMEPLSVGVHSVAKLGDFHATQCILVFGCGPIGLLCMAVAKALGASRIVAIDILPERLSFAREYAATDTYQPPPKETGESNVTYFYRNAMKLKKDLNIADHGPYAIDLVIDASGAEASIQTAFHVVKAGGTIVQVGMGNPNVTLNIGLLTTKEVVYKGSFRYGPGDYLMAIALVSQGKIDLKALVTHRFVFEDAKAAFETTRAGKGMDGKGVIKAIISGPGVSISDR